MRRSSLFTGLVVALALSGSLLADPIVVKDPDTSLPYWQPLSDSGSYVYADSFVFYGTTGTTVDTLGAWLIGGEGTSQLQFELLADTGSNAPNGSDVLTSSASVSFNLSSLTLETVGVTPYALTNGAQYWVALSTVGLAGAGSYQVGAHVQNSENIVDNGTFWYSNSAAGLAFDGQAQTPEMAIYVAGTVNTASTPEPVSYGTLLLGLGAIAVLRSRR